MNKKIRQWVLRKIAIRKFQPLFEKLHLLALKGMNYGSANSPLDSGEASILNDLVNELPENPIIFDVGANCGQYIDLLSEKACRKKIQIHVFEPDHNCFQILEQRFRRERNIVINNFAIGDKVGTAKLFSGAKASVNATLVESEENELQSTQVEVQTIDQYCGVMNVERIDFLKVDTEGFEINVLKGAKEMIRKGAIHRIQLEHGSLHSIIMGASLYKYSQLLVNYDIYHIKQDGLYKLDVTPINEIYYNSNYFFKLR